AIGIFRQPSALFVFEILDLAKSLCGSCTGFITTSQVLAFFRDHFITALIFLDHRYILLANSPKTRLSASVMTHGRARLRPSSCKTSVSVHCLGFIVTPNRPFLDHPAHRV